MAITHWKSSSRLVTCSQFGTRYDSLYEAVRFAKETTIPTTSASNNSHNHDRHLGSLSRFVINTLCLCKFLNLPLGPSKHQLSPAKQLYQKANVNMKRELANNMVTHRQHSLLELIHSHSQKRSPPSLHQHHLN